MVRLRVLYFVDTSGSESRYAPRLADDPDVEVVVVRDLHTGKQILEAGSVDCIVAEFAGADGDGLAFLEWLHDAPVDLPVIPLAGATDEETLTAAMDAEIANPLPTAVLDGSADGLAEVVRALTPTVGAEFTRSSAGAGRSAGDHDLFSVVWSALAAGHPSTADGVPGPDSSVSDTGLEFEWIPTGGEPTEFAWIPLRDGDRSGSPRDVENTAAISSLDGLLDGIDWEAQPATRRRETASGSPQPGLGGAPSEQDAATLVEDDGALVPSPRTRSFVFGGGQANGADPAVDDPGERDPVSGGEGTGRHASTTSTAGDGEDPLARLLEQLDGAGDVSSDTIEQLRRRLDAVAHDLPVDDRDPFEDTTNGGTEVSVPALAPATDVDGDSDPPDETDAFDSEAYRRPADLDLRDGTSVLLQCGSQDDRMNAACVDLLGVTEPAPLNVLLIRFKQMSEAHLEEIATNAERTTIISIGYNQPVPRSIRDGVETLKINNPNDVMRLGILVSGIAQEWESTDADTVVCFYPLDVLLRYKTIESSFRFLHLFLSNLQSFGIRSHFHVDPSAGDPQDTNTLKPLFDEVLTIDSVGTHLEH